MVNRYLLEWAQAELAIAEYIGDEKLWRRAMKRMADAMGLPLRREHHHI